LLHQINRREQRMQTVPVSRGTPMSAQNQIWWLRGAAVIATIGLLAASMPIVWVAASAGLGLLSLAAMGILGAAVFQALPWAMQRFENHLLVLRKAQARANPIEQLQNECVRREQRLQSFRRALVTIGGQIESMGQMVEDRAHQDPGHVLERQQRALKRMAQFYDCNLVRLNEAQSALEDFRHQIKQKMFEWDFAQAGQVVMAALRPGELNDLMQDLLTDEALRSVQNRFNTVFAELDVEMRSMDSPAYSLMDGSAMEQMDALTMPATSVVRSSR
jgi:hypothetical protein